MSAGVEEPLRPAPLSLGHDPSNGVTCPKCGTVCQGKDEENVESDSQRRIAELESQVRILTNKASAAVDKLADYEDELRMLKTAQAKTAAAPPAAASTLASFLGRKGSVSPGPSSTPPPQASSPAPAAADQDLLAQLAKERQLRASAESQLTSISSEMEDLSATLFQQANEMVAQERKARAELEERVKMLEVRDAEKRKRLERLEKAIERIERVRGILGQQT